MSKQDHDTQDCTALENSVQDQIGRNERYEIHQTWVTRRNFWSGTEFQERYDTPYYCSPASETYWAM